MASHFFPLMRREFEESEVLEVVRNFNEDKALRPNGFSMVFFLGGIKREHYGGVQGVL
jgi:hypothetical protein